MFKRTKITDGLEYVEPVETAYPIVSGGIILTSTPKIIIDSNAGPESTKSLLNQEQPDIVIVSHYHLDHAMIGYWAQEMSGTELLIPEGEDRYLTDLDYFIQNTNGSVDKDPKWHYFIKNVVKYRKMEGYGFHDGKTEIRSGQITLKGLPGSGHSPSHTAFYFPEAGILFACDIGLGLFGPWYGWVDCDLGAYVETILSLRSLNVNRILTSHDGIIEKDLQGAWNRCLGYFFKREQIVMDSLDQGKTKQEIVEKGVCFFNKSNLEEPFKTLTTMWDSIMFDHHVEMLENGSLCRAFPELVQYSNRV